VGVPLGEIVAVGDNLNDVAMLRAAGLGVAVEGSPPEVLAVARWVCPPPEREGVREVIERLFLSDDAKERKGGRGT
jgi:hydroxymethylpyrimidine pyrophosphatase-like HAD family hydrolase